MRKRLIYAAIALAVFSFTYSINSGNTSSVGNSPSIRTNTTTGTHVDTTNEYIRDRVALTLVNLTRAAGIQFINNN